METRDTILRPVDLEPLSRLACESISDRPTDTADGSNGRPDQPRVSAYADKLSPCAVAEKTKIKTRGRAQPAKGTRKVPLLVAITVAYPYVVLLGALAVAATATALSLSYFDLSNPLVGLRIRDDVTAERADAWYESLFVLRPESGDDNNVRQTQQSVEYNSLTILYMAPGAATQEHPSGNVFTVENIQKMAALEDSLLQVPDYASYCQVDDNGDCATVLSPVQYLRNATTQEEIDQGLLAMWADREADKDATLFHFCKDFDNVTHLDCPMTRSKIRFGLPLQGFLNADDRTEEQGSLLEEWFWDRNGADESGSMFGLLSKARQGYLDDPVGELVITFDQQNAFDRETIVILGSDALFVGYSVVALVVVMSIHMNSLFLGVFGTIQVLLSFPTCFFIYRVIFGIELFGGLSIISIYLLLGVASDDIFLCADALRQAKSMLHGPGWTLEKRAAWAFHRAFYTMATTTITTTVAFIILASSTIPVIRYFGIWTALLLKTISSEAASMPPTRVESFFRDTFGAKLILRTGGRAIIFAVFGAFSLIALGYATQVRLASKSLVFWADDHYFGLIINNDGPESFKKTDESSFMIKTVWGLADPPIDRAGTKETLDMDLGVPVFDDAFDLASEDAQIFLRNMCADTLTSEPASLYLETELHEEDRARCFMLAFANWREARGEAFPVPNAGVSDLDSSIEVAGGINIPARAQNETLAELLVEFLRRPEFGKKLYQDVGFERLSNGNLRVRFAVQEFALTATDSDSFERRTGLGSIESVVVSLSFGISIDFSLHFAVAYSDAYFDRNLLLRKERVEHALLTLGTSITFGALSTLVATSMLLLATITFFSIFAKILCVAVATAYLYAIFLLPATLATFGPEGTKGFVCVSGALAKEQGSRVDHARSESMETRSPAHVRKWAAAYAGFSVILVAVFVGANAVRSAQMKDEEDSNSATPYDDTYSMPTFSDLEIGAWTEMRPGNSSICARGTPFAFFIKRGEPDEPMIIEFEGGGACWSTSTCQAASSTFSDTIDLTRAAFQRITAGSDVPSGLADPNGPYANFTHVYIPYCTADLHAGNSVVNYTSALRIQHRGSVNVEYVLKYVEDEVPAPPRALITGCSAGSYGSFWHAPRIIKMFAAMGAGTEVMQMGDSGMGVITDEFLAESFPSWKVTDGGAFDFDIVPSGTLTDPLDLTNLTMGVLYQWAAEAFPDAVFSQYSSAYDWNQAFFLLVQKVGSSTDPVAADKLTWNAEMRTMYDSISSSRPSNLVNIVGPGDHHCVVPFSRYYTMDSGNGTPLFQIIHDMFINGASPVEIDCRDNGSCAQSADLRDEFTLLIPSKEAVIPGGGLRYPAMLEIAMNRGTVTLTGSFVEHAVARFEQQVPEPARRLYQSKRGDDVVQHHVTLLTPSEVKTLRNDPEVFSAAYAALQEATAGPLVALGLGRAGRDSMCWFVVVSCPGVQRVRRQFGLEANDLHITLGFTSHDLHEVDKDATTVMRIQRESLSSAEIETLLREHANENLAMCDFLVQETSSRPDLEALSVRALLTRASRDDLLFPVHERSVFVGSDAVIIEEKIDGANLGLYVDADWRIVAQNRAHSVCSETAPQWSSLDRWIEPRKVRLCEALGHRFAVFGEWMYAKHSIHYSRLPDHFIAFDVFDRWMGRFLSVRARNRVLEKAGLVSICRVKHKSFSSVCTLEQDVCALLEQTQSAYYDGPVEGLVIRRDEEVLPYEAETKNETGSFLERRAKIVRASFSQGIEDHWTRATLVRNGVVPQLVSAALMETQKYPSTPHLPFSPSVHSDDSLLPSSEAFCGKRIIITEKLDGGNCCLAPNSLVYARTHAKEATHWSFGAVKELYGRLQAQYPDLIGESSRYAGAELYGECMAAVHSIEYDQLTSPFYLFAVRLHNLWLAWDEVRALAEALEIPTVPVVFDGKMANEEQLRTLLEAEAALPSRVASDVTGEGFVVRVAGAFATDEKTFEQSIAKYVRAGHIQTSANWKSTCCKAKIQYGANFAVRKAISSNAVQLYVDLDGVLADFDAGVMRVCGRPPQALPVAAMWRAIHGDRDFFGTLEWMPGARALWQETLASMRPTILSGVPMSESRWAERQKASWCARQLGPDVPHIFCASREKSRYSGPGRVLIDDRERARKPWEAAGGTFILYKTPHQVAVELRDVIARQQATSESSGVQGTVTSGATGATAAKMSTLRKCKFRLVLLVGLPGSGKSTFAKAFSARYRCEYISQDELGSRRACESWIGQKSKQGVTVVLDRCNVERAERKYWIELAMVQAKQVAIVYFAPPGEHGVLAQRLVSRQGHPTIQTANAKSAQRIIDSFAKRLEPPSMTADLVGRVFTISEFNDTDAVLGVLGAPK
ncbi:Pectin acetylesterase 3 [Hondaea fermentalgiana]|uniref:Pectin acetylesterase 3 n=1 Tax=Hondaea fermentalgiana TaxID=2315210 RepID=A0A2R5G5V2_9STRA|nr:Pectin acetylesterase 3 [Hondaea fermentalgiana]|eukprot:GBG25719.1 Pectin acetylesterase 3 [Hondaea fermentalgiana]